MARTATYSVREFELILKNNGYNFARQHGSHKIWKKEGCANILYPAGKVNKMMARRLIKENNLNVA